MELCILAEQLGRASFDVAMARLGMQIMAGHGYATESVMSFRWRESIVSTISGGTSQIQRNGIAGTMGLHCY